MAQQVKAEKSTDRMIVKKSGAPPWRVLSAMPVQVFYQPPPMTVSVEKRENETIFRCLAPKIVDWPKHGTLDAYALRESFLATQTSGEAVELLCSSGLMCLEPGQDGRFGLSCSLTWTEFQQWQQLIRAVLTDGFFKLWVEGAADGTVKQILDVPEKASHLIARLSPEEQLWLAGIPCGISILPSEHKGAPQVSGNLMALVGVSTILEAILATIYIDGLNGLRYALCSLPDCPKIYEITSKHKRLYCSNECAHKASVRKRRSLEAKKKKIKSTRSKQGGTA